MKLLTRLSLIALFAVGSITAVQAAPVSDITTGNADLIFGSTDTASITITPVTGLKAGPNTNTLVADVAASVTAGTVAIRWRPGTGTIYPKSNRITIAGKYTGEQHDFWFGEEIRYGASSNMIQSASDMGWWYTADAASSVTFKITNAYTQTFPIDVFRLSMDAAVWVE